MRTIFLLPIFFWMTVCFANVESGTGIYLGVRGSRMGWNTNPEKYYGYTVGPSVGFDYRKPNNVYAAGRFYINYGDLTGGECGRDIQDMNMQFRVGYTAGVVTRFTLYAGVGTNIIEQKRKQLQDPCEKLTYVDIYIPVGVVLTRNIRRDLSFGIDAQWQPDVDAWVRIGGFRNIHWELNHKSSFLVEAPLQFVFPSIQAKWAQFRFIPFYRRIVEGDASVKTFSNSSRVNLKTQTANEWGLYFELAIL